MTTPPLDLPALRERFTDGDIIFPEEMHELLDRVEEAEVWTIAHPCVFAAMEPYDFKWCETHDRTFPLDGDCDHKGKSYVDWLDSRASEQRVRAIRAEDRAEAAEKKVAAVRELHESNGQSCENCFDSQGFWENYPCPTITALDGKA